MKKALVTILFFVTTAVFAGEPVSTDPQNIGIGNEVGRQVSLDLSFKDETGKVVQLKDYFDGKTPAILALVYYGCPDLCTFVLNSLTESLKKNSWSVGEKFSVLTVSIDPKETPELAAQKKVSYLKDYNRPGAENGWHFLTGDEVDIKKLADEVGFHYNYNAEEKQFAHAAGIFILTPAGQISQVLFGSNYNPREIKSALLEAIKGKLSLMDRFLLLLNLT